MRWFLKPKQYFVSDNPAHRQVIWECTGIVFM